MDAARRLAEHIVFVLVQPQHPGNVGATARAMRNMGLHRLVVVDPAPSFDLERARWMAPGATDVLRQMRIVSTLDEALQGVHRVAATTARHRKHGQPVHEPKALAVEHLQAPEDSTLAILFGREDTGLTNEHTSRAESLLRIPTAEHASLNLSQAVLLVAHAIFEAGREHGLVAGGRMVGGARRAKSTRRLQKRAASPLAPVTVVEPALLELVALLNRVGYRKASSEQVEVTLREALQRASLTERQVTAMRGMVGRVEFALDRPDIDWQASKRQQARKASLDDAD